MTWEQNRQHRGGKKWVQLTEAIVIVGHPNCQKWSIVKRNACKVINQSHKSTVLSTMLHSNDETIAISHIFSTNGKTNFQSGEYYRVSFQKTWGDIQRDNSCHSWEITSNFSSTSNPKSSWFKIEPPSTSLVTTSCKLKPLRSKGTNPETKGTLSTTAELKSCRNASTLRLTSSRCNKENRLKTHLGHVTVSRTPTSLSLNNSQRLIFFFKPSWQT